MIISVPGYESVALTLGTMVNQSGSTPRGGVIGTGDITVDDGDTNCLEFGGHLTSDPVTTYDSFRWPIDAPTMPGGAAPVAVSFHFIGRSPNTPEAVHYAFGDIDDSPYYGTPSSGNYGQSLTSTLTDTSYGLHEEGFDSYAPYYPSQADQLINSWGLWPELAATLLAGTSSVVFDTDGSLDPAEVVRITKLEMRVWYAVAVVSRRPHCRIFPRDDNRGPSRRIYPPPVSAQTPGRLTGYQ